MRVVALLLFAMTWIGAAEPSAPLAGRSPLAEFREWIGLSPAEREAALASKPASQRETLRAKIKEYASLPAEQRETRLRLVELRWYLRPLMEHPATNRAADLAAIPDSIRPLVKERIEQWDALKPEVRREVLENEWALQYFVRLRSARDDGPKLLTSMSVENRPELEAKLKRWEGMSPAQRESLARHFNRFFQLSSKEKAKTLQAFTDEERAEMQRTLEAFEKLSPEQRRACVTSFEKFATMTPEQRAQFLKNAERWQSLPAEDRAAWRDLVKALPPMPPIINSNPAPMPGQ